MKFTDLDLHPAIQENLNRIQFETCTPIQEQAIPHILAGKDLAGLAQTGTGKTAAFMLPLIDRVLRGKNQMVDANNPARQFSEWQTKNFILILVPTRELAEQVSETSEKMLQGTGLRIATIYGGTAYDKQKAALRDGFEFIVATPGRLIDLYKEHLVDLRQVRAIVFDEADRMFDMGFKDDMKFILKRMNSSRQFLVFSATLNFDVLNVAYEYGAQPVEINISKDQAKAENVDDEIYHVGTAEKPAHLLSLLKKYQPQQVIVFSNFKHNVERIARFLSNNGYPAVGISSLLTQAQRNRVMSQFRSENDRNIMVATDVAARGLDILGVDLVINYELPDDAENYVHRIGRTGRAGNRGRAFSLVADRDVDALTRIEDYVGNKLRIGWIESSELIKEFKPFPAERDMGFKRHGRPARPSSEDRQRFKQSGRSGGDRGAPRPPARDFRRDRPAPPQDKSTHRDRKMGRHRHQPPPQQQRPQHSPSHRPQQGGGGASRPKVAQTSHRVQHQRRPLPSSHRRVVAPASLGQRVSAFLKKLFS